MFVYGFGCSNSLRAFLALSTPCCVYHRGHKKVSLFASFSHNKSPAKVPLFIMLNAFEFGLSRGNT